jgi:DNA-binding transcriptional regulator YdaS (Cro superfamily)
MDPMPTVAVQTLRRARDIVGDDRALAKLLGVNGHWIKSWLLGAREMPSAIFLKAVDIVVEHDLKDATRRGHGGNPPATSN